MRNVVGGLAASSSGARLLPCQGAARAQREVLAHRDAGARAALLRAILLAACLLGLPFTAVSGDTAAQHAPVAQTEVAPSATDDTATQGAPGAETEAAPPAAGDTATQNAPAAATEAAPAPQATLEAAGQPVASPPAPAGKEIPFRILEADAISYDEQSNRLVAQGHVVVEYKDYRVSADVLAADFEDRVATFRGRVVLTTPERVIHGTLLSLDLRSRAYALEGARMLLAPEEVQMGAQQPLYASSARIDGEPGVVSVKQGGITSCDLGSPHYLFDAQKIQVIPGKRLTARKVSVYALGHKLITLPGLTIPLSSFDTPRSNRFVPLFGQSLDEGYFMKAAYFYVLGSLIGNLRLDLMSKKGTGIGLDQPYDFPNYSGGIHVYQLNNRRDNRRDFTARVDHQHQLGEFALRFGGDYRLNSLPYATADSSSLLTDLAITRRGADGTTTDLGFNRSASTYSGTTTGNWLARLRHSQNFGFVRANLSMDMSQPFGMSTASSGRLSSRLDLQHSNRLFDAGLLIDRIDTLGGTANFFPGMQHLPELRLATASQRLTNSDFFTKTLPISMELRVGNLREGGYALSGSSSAPAMTERLRTYFRVSSSPQVLPSKGRFAVTLPVDFQQNYYREDEAMWAAGISPALTYRMGESSLISLNYSLMRKNGYTPFTSDYAPEAHQMSLSATFGSRIRRGVSTPAGYSGTYSSYSTGLTGGYGVGTSYAGAPYGWDNRRLDPAAAGKTYITFNTGYDFDLRNASDLVVRTQYQPNAHHLIEMESAYDWFGKRRFGTQKRLRDIRARWYVDYGDPLQLAVGTVWDTSRNRLGTIKASLSSQISPKWQVQSLYGRVASGYGSSQPYTQVMLTRDLHCWEASAIYTEGTFLGRKERELRFVMSIKAFPVNKEFGVSPSGQYLSTDIGSIY
ncbi:MAG TPA: hypothetical protein PLU39_11390 [Armatimonadota bacterium]|nr:LPS-assembly protein LptD [Armatimonadota bacterium]HOM80810.1 hypothetical protein [Armatimonadota bacterium]HOQ28296.1 hypothetical protein [Armatimonadota bacterium]HPO72422.1 hypothetical protein [Armatimonadota bacterium]HPT98463.1 hypothetical protein [Armatimonadota bacterium]